MEMIIMKITVGIMLILLVILLIVLCCSRIRIRKNSGYKTSVHVIRDGVNIEKNQEYSGDTGLNGFGEDKSGTFVLNSGRKKVSYVQLVLVSRKTGIQYQGLFAQSVIIGRGNSYDSKGYINILEDPAISRVHAEVIRNNNKLYVQDKGSANHTWLNGNRLSGSAILRSGDVLQLAGSVFEVKVM